MRLLVRRGRSRTRLGKALCVQSGLNLRDANELDSELVGKLLVSLPKRIDVHPQQLNLGAESLVYGAQAIRRTPLRHGAHYSCTDGLWTSTSPILGTPAADNT